jgi:protease YdgD
VAGERRGAYLADAEVISIARSKDYDPSLPTSTGSLANDWAVLRLDHDVGSVVGILPLMPRDEVNGLAAGTKLTHAGYSQDKAHILTKHEGCRVLALNSALLRHDCDGFLIVAIHVATTIKQGEPEGLAVLPPPDLPR